MFIEPKPQRLTSSFRSGTPVSFHFAPKGALPSFQTRSINIRLLRATTYLAAMAKRSATANNTAIGETVAARLPRPQPLTTG